MQATGRTVTPEAGTTPLAKMKQVTTCANHGSQHEGIGTGEIPEGLSGGMGVACMERGVGDLGGPVGSNMAVVICDGVGKPGRSEERKADGRWGFGSTHSTLRAGEPSTWGRG